MRHLPLAFALLSLVPAAALAKPPAEVARPDLGAEAVVNPYDYEKNVSWTEPPAEGLRKLAVDDAEAFLRALTPVADAGEGKGNLVLINRASGWATIHINGQELGELGPLAFATLYGLKAGTYDVTYANTTGYAAPERVSTCGECTAADWPPED